MAIAGGTGTGLPGDSAITAGHCCQSKSSSHDCHPVTSDAMSMEMYGTWDGSLLRWTCVLPMILPSASQIAGRQSMTADCMHQCTNLAVLESHSKWDHGPLFGPMGVSVAIQVALFITSGPEDQHAAQSKTDNYKAETLRPNLASQKISPGRPPTAIGVARYSLSTVSGAYTHLALTTLGFSPRGTNDCSTEHLFSTKSELLKFTSRSFLTRSTEIDIQSE